MHLTKEQIAFAHTDFMVAHGDLYDQCFSGFTWDRMVFSDICFHYASCDGDYIEDLRKEFNNDDDTFECAKAYINELKKSHAFEPIKTRY